VTSIKDKVLRGDSLQDILNADLEASGRAYAASVDWHGLIAEALAAKPEPLMAVLIQMGGGKGLLPPEMLDFLGLMDEHAPKKAGRPRKDGKEALRSAAKAWRALMLKNSKDGIAWAYSQTKKYKIEISPTQGKVSIRANDDANATVWYLDKPTDFALDMMVQAGFARSPDALLDAIYKDRQRRKRKRQRSK